MHNYTFILQLKNTPPYIIKNKKALKIKIAIIDTFHKFLSP